MIYGCREIFELIGKWQDVDLEKKTAWLANPKNNRSVEIPLNDAAGEVITRQKPRGDYVFCHLNGKPFKTFLYKTIWNALKEAGITLPKNKAWHIFRRTWASMFLRSGGDVESLREQGNWSNFVMPMWYTDPASTEHRRDILNKFPKLNGRKMAENRDGTNISNENN